MGLRRAPKAGVPMGRACVTKGGSRTVGPRVEARRVQVEGCRPKPGNGAPKGGESKGGVPKGGAPNSFLLINLHIVQFQYGLEFLRLSYSEFVQAFQDVIRWDLRH